MNAESGGWYLHNQQRKGKGLQPEALDKDSPEHIQILTDYAKQHAAKFVHDVVCQRCAFASRDARRFGLPVDEVTFRQVRQRHVQRFVYCVPNSSGQRLDVFCCPVNARSGARICQEHHACHWRHQCSRRCHVLQRSVQVRACTPAFPHHLTSNYQVFHEVRQHYAATSSLKVPLVFSCYGRRRGGAVCAQ